ncbi:ArgE/DapE family deacylase [Rubrobacter aplysinae]|uniref:ArgE/DapE family deacylase n=1 Tax=Rubrobacter aplysinae TaxID=909625 RepID=UPI00069CE3DF|nr:ArgE/DapE family deacylase [Rubrobacter aplysinae]
MNEVSDEAVLDAVSAERGWMEDLLARLVEAPTTLGDEEAGQRLIQAAFAECGLDTRDVPLDEEALRAAPGASPFGWEVEGKRNVVADWEPVTDGGRSLILNGHIDVVPPAEESLWTHPPFEAVRDGDWLYGRGAGDMKAGLATMTGVVRALGRAGYAPAAPVQLQSVVEEECTGHGTLQCLLDGSRADACVITEPHPDHITIAQVGVLWFHVDVAGVPAHAARASRLGFNAIEAAGDVLQALRRLEERLNEDPPAPYDTFEHPINLNPGVISGGDWPSTVAASCTVSYRLGLYPRQDPGELRTLVEETVAEAARNSPRLAENPPRVRYDGFSCEGFVLGGEVPVADALAGAYQRLHGERPPLIPTTATTDARHFVREGIPAVCFGPRAEQIHGIDERVSLGSVVETAQALGLFVRDWCGLVKV